ncbi:MoaD/ThiS family protein [Clostridium saccharoperbutylacetonicum]|uniref:MoaD/ThiS family protein n=1 Tax=Clostridium saccharoperbutylacetonicum TaxID=36745 RepID=UPI0039EB59AF
MDVTIKYLNKLKKITGKSNEKISIKENSTLEELIIGDICKRYEDISNYMINKENSNIDDKIALFVNNEQVKTSYSVILKSNDVITILPPVIGG